MPDTIPKDKICGHEEIEYTRFDNHYDKVSWKHLNNCISFIHVLVISIIGVN